MRMGRDRHRGADEGRRRRNRHRRARGRLPALAPARGGGVRARPAMSAGTRTRSRRRSPTGGCSPSTPGSSSTTARTTRNLFRLFDELGVRTQESEMSFSVSSRAAGSEYSGARPWTQWRPPHPGVPRAAGRDRALHAHRGAGGRRRHGADARSSCARSRYSRRFRDHFLVPLAASIWSTVARARHSRLPGVLRDPLLREPRDAPVPPVPLAHRDRRQPTLRQGDPRTPRRPLPA